MRLHNLKIRNFRKLKDCSIDFRDTTFLIGPNNSGKSSVFAAIDCLHRDTGIDREDYSKTYNPETDDNEYATEVEIIAEYHDLPDEAHNWKGFKGRVIQTESPATGETSNTIVYKKVWSINTGKPKVYLKEHKKTFKEEYKQTETPKDLIGEALDSNYITEHFGSENLEKPIKNKPIQALLADLPEVWNVDFDSDPTWIENPGGIPGNVLSKLPRIVVIPAESCIAQLTNPKGALHSLLTDLFDEVRKGSKNYINAQEFLNKLAKELDPSDYETDFGKLVNELNHMTHSLFPDSSVHVSASLEQPDKAIKPQFSVEMQSNVRTAVPYQGHGMIRATAFQLLRYVQDYVNKAQEIPRSTIFCFEEPEIYLHPSAANQMRDSLYELAGKYCQIVCTTHSPYMVNLGVEKALSLTKFHSDNNDFTNTDSFNLKFGFEELKEDEKQNLKMLLKLDDHISRLFFSKKCIFVEGDTEEVVIRETIKRLSNEDKSRVVGNCEFLRARGKSVLISIAKYLNALNINYLILHDRDKGTPKAESFNEPILEAAGQGRRIMIEECIEDLLGYKAPSSEKPFKAYSHITNNWSDDFFGLPEKWKSIFLDLCEPYLDHLRGL